jgi:hypothetical protein
MRLEFHQLVASDIAKLRVIIGFSAAQVSRMTFVPNCSFTSEKPQTHRFNTEDADII